jgi:hypothetical protein
MSKLSFILAAILMATAACTGKSSGSSPTSVMQSGANGGADGSFISECLGGFRYVATFAPEGNRVDKYSFQGSDCSLEATVTPLSVSPKTDGKLEAGKLTVELPGFTPASFQGASVDTYNGSNLSRAFHMKYSGKCQLNGGEDCSETYYLVPYAGYDFPMIHWSINAPGGDIGTTSDDWITSSFETFDWRKSCDHVQKITVKAGRFETCVVQKGDYKIWYGQTPLFDIIKVEFTGDSSHNNTEAISLHLKYLKMQSEELSELSW